LVVAVVLAHGGVAVDHLLGRADRQRRELLELLERGAVAVHGRIVEVRTERGDRILRVLRDERLPAQAHDRLLERAVAVVGEALTVERDETLVVLLRPEDVVGEEAVTVERGLLGDLRRADRAVPYERRHTVEGTRGRGEAVERGAELALPVDDVLLPQLTQERV